MPTEQQVPIGAVVVAIANPIVRRALGDAFRHRGVLELDELHDYEQLKQILKNACIDVLVADDNLNDLFVGDLVRAIRQGELHEHPFPLIIMLAHRQEEKDLRALINSGPDAVVLTPISVAALTQKIEMLAAGRKQFVITRDYVGPDRRTAARAGSAPALTLDAPNPLQAGADRGAFNAALDKAKINLKEKKTECSLGQLAWAMQGNITEFSQLIPIVDQLVETVANPNIKAAAMTLAQALRKDERMEIMDACKALLMVARKKR